MSKTTIIAIFMVVLVLGLVTKETQGQEFCHEYMLGAESCEENKCVIICGWKHIGGKGACMPLPSKQCLCRFSCTV
ncbi:S locus-related glycoprotein 1 binding pollen coat protein [Arabidopsis suecica]|uniref:S locus-related glycoprotein 1 binding pollen coat protein n=1 Tax=Arabidopsis suecica TaxID=45249 RepID=A0A8T1ZVY2_ARASU|nr:S locus-related glycoprotein 1 binding pollen coat protein [Arabidopsis suecica]